MYLKLRYYVYDFNNRRRNLTIIEIISNSFKIDNQGLVHVPIYGTKFKFTVNDYESDKLQKVPFEYIYHVIKTVRNISNLTFDKPEDFSINSCFDVKESEFDLLTDNDIKKL